MLSPTQRKLAENLGIKVDAKVPKLIPNLKDKKNYITHYKNLQLYVRLGLKLTKIRKIARFHQSRWLEPYMKFNCDMRRDAASAVDRTNFKFLNNSCFGRFLLNKFKQIDVKLARNLAVK